jgi:hypothetical protein
MTGKPFQFCAALAVVGLAFGSARGANDSLYYLYQRSTYLENLNTPGGWWANPALTGEIAVPTGYTINVTPLGNSYTLASVKYLIPFLQRFGAGIGIMGTGIANQQSTGINPGGISFSSNYSFSNPSFQLGLGGRIPGIGSAGILVDIGAEMLPSGYSDVAASNFLLTRFGLGVLTPYYFGCASLSATGMATLHFWQQLYMDSDAKIGLRLKFLDEMILGSAEYTLSFKTHFIQSFYATYGYDYEVFKALVSVKIYKVAGILAGFSTDFNQSPGSLYNGNCLHAGLELRPLDIYPFFGGYDLGVSTTFPGLLIHRIWIGYRFLRKPQ